MPKVSLHGVGNLRLDPEISVDGCMIGWWDTRNTGRFRWRFRRRGDAEWTDWMSRRELLERVVSDVPRQKQPA